MVRQPLKPPLRFKTKPPHFDVVFTTILTDNAEYVVFKTILTDNAEDVVFKTILTDNAEDVVFKTILKDVLVDDFVALGSGGGGAQ